MSRYFRRGKTRLWFLPTIAAGTGIPTTTEIIAGTELTGAINNIKGFSFVAELIDTPDMASPFTSRIPGADKVDDSNMMIYLDDSANPLRTLLAQDVSGYIVINDFKTGVPAIADKVDVWKTRITGTAKQYDMASNPALWSPDFAILAPPALDCLVLA